MSRRAVSADPVAMLAAALAEATAAGVGPAVEDGAPFLGCDGE